MNIRYFRLLSGEDIITEVSDSSSETISFRNPLMLIMQENPLDRSKIQVSFMPYLGYIISPDQVVKVNKSSIILESDAPKKMVESYKETFSKVLQVKKPSIVIPGVNG